MPQGFINRMLSVFEGNPGVNRVAEDPILMAELLLLFRMIMADGEATEAELDTLQRICRDSFGIADADIDDVIDYLRDFGYETNIAQSLAMFRDLDGDRKRQLARHMVAIAKADQSLEKQEVALLARTLKLLEIEPSEILNLPH
jgi:uncharacterized tellurite resistance protein B-like protein